MNFSVYVNVQEEVVSLFFALNHTNYVRWMPIHISNMKSLPVPIKVEFVVKHHLVIPKTKNKFSAIPYDQGHEQLSKDVKRPGGAVGLTENPTSLRIPEQCLGWVVLK